VSLDAAFRKLSGARGRLFADPQPAAGEISFEVDNTSAAYYESAYYKLHKRDLQPVPEPRTPQPRVDLADVLHPDFVNAITATKKISFHAVGDTGAAKVNSSSPAPAQGRRRGSRWGQCCRTTIRRLGLSIAPCVSVAQPFGAVETPLHDPIAQTSVPYVTVFDARRTNLYDPFADVRVDATYFQKTPTRR